MGPSFAVPTTADSSHSSSGSKSRSGSLADAGDSASSSISASATAADPASEATSSSTYMTHDDSPGRGRKQRSQREATVSRRAGAEGRAEGQGAEAQGQFQLPSYQSLKDNMPPKSMTLSRESVRAIRSHLTAFKGSAAVQDQSLALYVNSQVCTNPHHYHRCLHAR